MTGSPADVLLDCRWLPIGGAGRVTAALLAGLRADPPEGSWVLLGPPAVVPLAWTGADVVVSTRDPRQGWGQRCWFELPPARLTVFLHQQRPLRALPAITTIYDTIQLRNASSPWQGRSRRRFLRAVARRSREVVTISEYSRSCIHRDLGYPLERITVAVPPVDPRRAHRLRRLRQLRPPREVALYVGQFAPHKNLTRLVEAYGATGFAARGGRLVLVGGRARELAAARALAAGHPSVEVRGWVGDEELDELMASARMLVQPSLEEGYGLPVAEAQACGLPVCVSTGGALGELTGPGAHRFSPTSVAEMAAALDACATGPAQKAPAAVTAAGARAFAGAYRRVVDRALGPPTPPGTSILPRGWRSRELAGGLGVRLGPAGGAPR